MVTLIEFAAIISALAGILVAIFVAIQLRHMGKHSDLEITLKLFEWAETDRLRRAFRWVETEFQFRDYESYKAQVAVNIDVGDYPYEVEAFFEQVGFLVNKSFVDIDVIVDRLGGLNAPHAIFGKTRAQAYDMSAYKFAWVGLSCRTGRGWSRGYSRSERRGATGPSASTSRYSTGRQLST